MFGGIEQPLCQGGTMDASIRLLARKRASDCEFRDLEWPNWTPPHCYRRYTSRLRLGDPGSRDCVLRQSETEVVQNGPHQSKNASRRFAIFAHRRPLTIRDTTSSIIGLKSKSRWNEKML